MEVKCPLDKNMNTQSDLSSTNEYFEQFIKDIVKSEVKSVFKSLSDEGVQAGKKDIEKSRRK